MNERGKRERKKKEKEKRKKTQHTYLPTFFNY